MDFSNALSHNELSWQRGEEELQRIRRRRDLEQLAEEMYTYQRRYAVARCDGDGIVEEVRVDVDLFDVMPCPSCCACDPENHPPVETVRVLKPANRKPMAREVADGAWPVEKGGVA